jgi:glycosyltransferase involved in cell wall biosynthesis
MPHPTASPPLRISFVLSSLWLSGGVWLVIECANHLVWRGHTVSIVAPGGAADDDLLRQIDPAIAVIESRVSLPEQRSPLALAALTQSLAQAIPPGDIVIATHTPTLAPTWLAARVLRKGRCAWLYMDYPRMFERRPLEGWMLQNAARWMDVILPISQPLADVVTQQTRAPVVIVRSGLPRAKHFFDRPRLPHSGVSKRILYVGDDRPRKGLQEFLRAAELVHRHHADTHFVIAAKQPCTLALTAPHEFHLRPSDEQLSLLYRSSDLFVSASWGEGLGYPPLEAMACGTPVVLTDSEGVRDYARHEENCLVVPPRAPEALAAAMLRVLDEPALARRLAQNGPPTARRYDWKWMADRMEEALRLIVGV